MFKSLDENQKFSSGSHLWFIFFEPHRLLFKAVNWRTCFLLQALGETKELLKPLLIDTHKVFPNNSILCLPLKQKTWFKEVYESWKLLDKPSSRVFIPSGCQGEELLEYWPTSDSFHELSYYRDNNEKI